MPRQRRLAHVIVLPLRCHTLQSFPHPYSRIHVTADRCPPAVAGCVLFPGPARLQGVAPYERPLRPPPLPVTYARCSLGLPVLGASRPSSLIHRGRSRMAPAAALSGETGSRRRRQVHRRAARLRRDRPRQIDDRNPARGRDSLPPGPPETGDPVRPEVGTAGPQTRTSTPSAPIAGTRPGYPGPAAGAASPRRPDHVAVVGRSVHAGHRVHACSGDEDHRVATRRPQRQSA